MSTPSLPTITHARTLKCTVQNLVDGALASSVDAGVQRSIPKITNGNAASQANRFWQRTQHALTSGSHEDINLFSFAGIDVGAGAGNDGLGVAMALAKVVAVLIVNDPASIGNLVIGGEGTANTWTSWISSNAATVGPYTPGADFSLFVPAGLAVGSANNQLLRIAAAGGNVVYDMYVLGNQ
jgi:hypothetical protein